MLRKSAAVACLAVTFMSCGATPSSLLDNSTGTQKTTCPGDHQGFFVCMSSDSSLSDTAVAQAIVDGLAKVIGLVNTQTFQGQVATAFSADGSGIASSLVGTNYIVSITGYCDASSSVLATATVGGDTIQYNECTVQRDSAGQPDVAAVAGVLLHEISHNIGYTHPAVNPSRLTVPYYLGDLADADLAPTPTEASGGGTQPPRRRYALGD